MNLALAICGRGYWRRDVEYEKAALFYKERGRIEQGFGRLKRFKRVALRRERTAENFRSIVSFATRPGLIKFTHTA